MTDIEEVVGTALRILAEDGMTGTLEAISKANAFTALVRVDGEDYVIVDFTEEMDFEDKQRYIEHCKCLYIDFLNRCYYEC